MSEPSVLAALVSALRGGSIEVVDLTSPLSSSTPVIQLSTRFGQSAVFELEEISRYDDRGPAWYRITDPGGWRRRSAVTENLMPKGPCRSGTSAVPGR
ncbi:hypothetical protein AQJ67_07045 [Streptomyces caeruleatus]|uniref:Uncharacterized protein n=1 Tax=Streptomyces caeruleatus TaxID=661399 RepID=A0A101U6I2_9ACTN|nr:hypothetical protein AQJ67_07045 [Streptomyces caeruleatus]